MRGRKCFRSSTDFGSSSDDDTSLSVHPVPHAGRDRSSRVAPERNHRNTSCALHDPDDSTASGLLRRTARVSASCSQRWRERCVVAMRVAVLCGSVAGGEGFARRPIRSVTVGDSSGHRAGQKLLEPCQHECGDGESPASRKSGRADGRDGTTARLSRRTAVNSFQGCHGDRVGVPAREGARDSLDSGLLDRE